ncbi:hypothetical protein P9112_000462 [Eukaryota sp. TZLM1-RC]
MRSVQEKTAITGTRKELVLSPVLNPANLVAPILNNTGQVAVSRFVDALNIYASRVSAHFMSDMTRCFPFSNSRFFFPNDDLEPSCTPDSQ